MAYRRRQGNLRPSTYEDIRSPEEPPSLAAQAIRASSAHRDSSLSSAYSESAFSSAYRDSADSEKRPSPPRDSKTYEYTSIKSLNESKNGFWSVLARKAKSIIEDDNAAQLENPNKFRPQKFETVNDSQYHNFHASYQPPEGQGKNEGPAIHKRLDALTSSLNYIGGKVGNALEEGLSIVEHRTADIIQETRKLNIRRKGTSSNVQNQGTDTSGHRNITQLQNDQETQLKASRDVANAMAAKAKLLLRELKTVKADLAFAKARCSQLEEENKILRDSRKKEDYPEDDDLIRLQLETLLAEKARLAHENSVYTRENRFLREIVEFHQLTMQDVVYLDEGTEEVTEVYPTQLPTLSSTRTSRSPSPSTPTPQVLTPIDSFSHSAPQTQGTLSPQISIAKSAIGVSSSSTLIQESVLEVPGNADACLQEALETKKLGDT